MSKPIIDQVKETVKNKHKEENKMKKQIIITVVITLAAVLAFIATFIGGMNYQKSQDELVEAKAAGIVKSVQVKVEPSK